MKPNQSEDNSPLHQTVASGFEFKAGKKSIAVEFTEQQLSAQAGSATFWAWVHGTLSSATPAFNLVVLPGDEFPDTGDASGKRFRVKIGQKTPMLLPAAPPPARSATNE